MRGSDTKQNEIIWVLDIKTVWLYCYSIINNAKNPALLVPEINYKAFTLTHKRL